MSMKINRLEIENVKRIKSVYGRIRKIWLRH